jgi:ATP-dependent Clp protease ATP-binding subunit ClpC
MRPELLNRIDNTIVFRALTRDEIIKILDLQLADLERRLVRHGLGLKVQSSAKKYLGENGYDIKNGVRPLRRLLQETLEDHVSQGLLDNSYGKGDMISVSLKNNKLLYKANKE